VCLRGKPDRQKGGDSPKKVVGHGGMKAFCEHHCAGRGEGWGGSGLKEKKEVVREGEALVEFQPGKGKKNGVATEDLPPERKMD